MTACVVVVAPPNVQTESTTMVPPVLLHVLFLAVLLRRAAEIAEFISLSLAGVGALPDDVRGQLGLLELTS